MMNGYTRDRVSRTPDDMGMAPDPMMNVPLDVRLLGAVNGVASRMRYLASHYADVLTNVEDGAREGHGGTSGMRWVRPTSENPTTRGRKPCVLSNGARVSREVLGISAAEWERMRVDGTARPAIYSDDYPAGSSYGGTEYGTDGLALIRRQEEIAQRLSRAALLAYRTGNRVALRSCVARAWSILAILARDGRTKAAFRQLNLPNPNAHTDETAAERAMRERRGHHQDVTVDKTYRNPTADATARWDGRSGEAYRVAGGSVSERDILAALESDGFDNPVID